MEFDSPINKNTIDDLNFKRIINEVKFQKLRDANKQLGSLDRLENMLYEELYGEEEKEIIKKRKKKLQDLKNANRKFKI